MAGAIWSIVLAAGQGKRLAGVTGGIPKQFWAPPGSPSLLEGTMDRLAPVVPASRTFTVIGSSQRAFAARVAERTSLGEVLVQPQDRGTAAGVLLALSHPRLQPHDIVILTPSDHGVANVGLFRRSLLETVEDVRAERASVVLFGVEPTSATGDFGWVMAEQGPSRTTRDLRRVGLFVEKPDPAVAATLFRAGAAWNTMVLVAKVESLRGLFRRHVPTLVDAMSPLAELEGAERERAAEVCYRTLPVADFSHDVITPAEGLRLRIWPRSMGWTDLGTPDRLRAWLHPEAAGSPPAPVAVPAGTSARATAAA
jgi:mannose-1-phosphate guanylyltransferase